MHKLGLTTRVLLPIALTTAVIIGVVVFSTQHNQFQYRKNAVAQDRSSVEGLFHAMLNSEAEKLQAAMASIVRDPQFLDAVRRQDREGILRWGSSLFETLRKDFDITHFYCLTPNRVNIVRLHNPTTFGDVSSHWSLLEAERSGKMAWGIELGKRGTFTLRANLPLYVGQERIGYLQLGEEVDHLLQAMQESLKLDLVMLIYKDKIRREGWEEGMKLLQRSADWNRMGDSVVIDETFRIPTERLSRLLAETKGDPLQAVEFEDGDTVWYSGILPVRDAAGVQVGNLAFFRNATAEAKAAHRSLLWLTGAAIAVGGVLVGFFGLMLRKVERSIVKEWTNRQATEDELRESEMKYRTLFNSMTDAVMILDNNGFLDCNPATLKMFGCRDRTEFCGKHPAFFSPPLQPCGMDSVRLADERIRTAQQAGTLRFEWQHKRLSGEEFPAEVVLAAMNLRDRLILLAVVHDLTHSKEYERKLQEYQGRLETLVLERTKELKNAVEDLKAENAERRRAETNLRRAMEVVEAANRAKGDFLTAMSHDIRTPMNGVIGMTSLLLDSGLTEEQKAYVQTVRDCGEQMLTVVGDVLDYTRLESGQLDLEMIDFDLRRTVEETVETLAVRASQKDLELLCYVEATVPPRVRGDPGRVRQVLGNLLNNAVKFTERGEVSIRVTSVEHKKSHAIVRFVVQDTGVGIPPDRIQDIFDPFAQPDGSSTPPHGGTGLGLTLCKRLVGLMGGHIGVESQPGKGSTFWFTISLERATEQVPAPDLADLNGLRVLGIDDNQTNRKILQTYLERGGCRASVVASSEGVLDILREAKAQGDPFRIAVLDWCLPGEDGPTLGRRIRQDHELDDTSLIMLTSVGQRGDVARLDSSVFDGYLVKPVRRSDLLDLLRMVLGRKKGQDITAPQSVVTRHTVAEGRKTRARVLVVEDNRVNQKLAVHLLQRVIGCRADGIANGREAVEALSRIDYDLVLMDCRMPEMDGYEATRTIRDPQSNVRNHNVPIIAMTAYLLSDNREKCLAAGMNDYLAKPLDEQKLAEVIDKYIVSCPIEPT